MRDSPALYGSGHCNLDRDHEILLAIVKSLEDPGLDSTGLSVALTHLFAYLDSHFEHEEELMDRYEYPLAAAHKESHRLFRAEAVELGKACIAPGPAVTTLVKAARAWMENHICEVDAQFGRFLNGHELERRDADVGIF